MLPFMLGRSSHEFSQNTSLLSSNPSLKLSFTMLPTESLTGKYFRWAKMTVYHTHQFCLCVFPLFLYPSVVLHLNDKFFAECLFVLHFAVSRTMGFRFTKISFRRETKTLLHYVSSAVHRGLGWNQVLILINQVKAITDIKLRTCLIRT